MTRESAAGPTPQTAEVGGFFDTLRGAVLTSIPAVSALVFVVVAVKVFRASMMETTTTVAIVSSADVFALLKGVILTLLPGFLAGLVAASIWWWGGVLPRRFDDARAREEASSALFAPQAVFAWGMVVVAFFTIWWPVFLILLVPVLGTTAALSARWARGSRPRDAPSPRRKGAVATLLVAGTVVILLVAKAAAGISWSAFVVLLVPSVVLIGGFLLGWWRSLVGVRLRGTVRVFGLLAAAVFVGILALEPSVWLPLRTITFLGTPPTVKSRALDRQVAAYVLSRDKDGMSLLLENPRAVVQVKLEDVDGTMPLCVPPESSGRVLTLRASQVLGLDPDPHSPYGTCPGMQRKRL
jgi:hypothetical protein